MTITHKIIHGAIKILGLLSLLSVVGCIGTRVNIPNIPEQNKVYDKTRGRTVMGKAAGFQLFGFIPISTNMRQSRAYEQLVSQANGGFLTQVQVMESWTFCYVGTKYWTTLTAIVYPYAEANTMKQVALKNSENPIKGTDELKANKIITKEEYNQTPSISTPLSSQPAVSSQDISARLKKLKELKDTGALTDEEYSTRRKALVDQL